MAAASRVQHYVLTLAATAKALSTVLADAANEDVGCRQITLFVPATGNSGLVYVGASGVTTTSYGFSFPTTGGTQILGPFDTGPIKLSDLFAVGTANDKLYITIIPF